MAVPAAVREAFAQWEPARDALGNYAGSTIRAWCDQQRYLFSDRNKELDSLSEKLDTGRYAKWSEIDDLYACTIVVPTVSHEPAVLEFLNAAFDPITLRGRNQTSKAPDVFRFDSTRLIARVPEPLGLTMTPGVSNIMFEIQVQTVFEYAWSVVTHDLVYKPDDVDWRKERLAAQLKAAVEQIELVIAGFEANLDFVAQSKFPDTDAKERLVESCKRLVAEGHISESLVPRSWGRFADNVLALVRSSVARRAAAAKLDQLREHLETAIPLTTELADLQSGSLFQAVASVIGRGEIEGATLDKFVLVDSPELQTFFGLPTVPKAFDFE